MTSPIDVGTAAVLGAVQGLTEFLPISSDGHVALGGMLFGISDELPLSLVVLFHLGTLLATAMVFREDVAHLTQGAFTGLRDPRSYLATDDGRLVVGILVASIPTALIGLALEPHVEDWARVPWIVGVCLLGSAVMVFVTRWGGGSDDVLPPWKTLLIGVAQGLAVLPGLTRSGSTIAVAMLLGLSGPAAFRFSFLLSLPAVLGATLLKAGDYAELAALGPGVLVGALTALVVGYVALRWLRTIVDQGRFWIFALYLVPLGFGLLAWDLIR